MRAGVGLKSFINAKTREILIGGLLLVIAAGGGISLFAQTRPAVASVESLQIDRGNISLTVDAGLPVSEDAVRDWVMRAGTAITQFYGRYPVESVAIYVRRGRRGGVQNGVEHGGRRIDIALGVNTTASWLNSDWMMTHEMFHLSQPSLDDRYRWMSEGMADYLEPVARVRIGQITPERFWKDMVEGMPFGLPKAGDEGLDNTHTWGRTYWGGMMYWLLADMRIREETQNKKSVRDAAMAVLNAGGNGSQDWTIEQLLSAYDGGTGTKVFTALHDEMGDKAVTTDLNALWKSLGVVYSDETRTVNFDDGAKLAEIRRGITAR